MLSDQALPKYREAKSLLNELFELVKEYEGRSAKANKLLLDNRLTEQQKVAYDKMTKELAILKNSHTIMEKLVLHHERLTKLAPGSKDFQEALYDYITSNKA